MSGDIISVSFPVYARVHPIDLTLSSETYVGLGAVTMKARPVPWFSFSLLIISLDASVHGNTATFFVLFRKPKRKS